MILRVYRRQSLIQDICRRVEYQGRYVWLVSATSVRVIANINNGQSRIRYRGLRIDMPGEFEYLGRKEGNLLRIQAWKAIVALPILRNRRRTLFIFMHPCIVEQQRWACNGKHVLMPEEAAALLHDDSAFDSPTMAVARAICIHRGLLTYSGKLTAQAHDLLRDKRAPHVAASIN